MHQRSSGHQEVPGSADHGVMSSAEHPQEQINPTVPFLYNKHVLPAALPGIVFILTMAGELLLAILTIGAFVMYLMISGGAEQNAVIAYICTFIAAQMTVLYSCLPLVWISFFNIPLLMLLNMFLGLTGGWGLVQFSFFINDQPRLAQMIEVGLFSLYPLVSMGLVTWLVVYLTFTKFATYVAIMYGFLLLRICLKPTVSSFHKLYPQQKNGNLILGDAETAAVLIVYLGFPCLLFFSTHIITFLQGNIAGLLELVLVAILPVFLITFIQLRGVYEQLNITLAQVSCTRLLLGLATLFLSCLIINMSGLSSSAPWLFPVILCHTLLGFALSKGNQFRFLSLILAIATILVSLFAIYLVTPISLKIPTVSHHLVTCIIIINVMTSVVSVLFADKDSKYLSSILILHSVVLVHSESFLVSKGLYFNSLAAITVLIEAYLLHRLHSTSKVTQHCLWMTCSMHALKFPLFLLSALQVSENDIHFGILAGYSSVAFMFISTKTLMFENQTELQPSALVKYLVCSACSMLAFIFTVVRPLVIHFFHDVGIVTLLLFVLLLTSAASCKLTLCNMKQNPHYFKLSGIFFFFSGFSLLVQAPIVTEYVSPLLLFMIETAVVLHFACVSSLLKSPHPRLYALCGGLLLGIPIGFTCRKLLLPQVGPPAVTAYLYALLSVEVTLIILLLWRYSLNWKTRSLVECTKDTFLHFTFVAFVIISLSLFISDVVNLTKTMSLWSAFFVASSSTFLCTVCGILSISIRIFCLKWQQQDPFSYQPGLLPTYSNVLTIVTYLLALLINPLSFPEIWNSAASIILLCLQQDLKIFPNFRAAIRTSTIFAVCISQFLFFSLKHSILWTKQLNLFAVLEIIVLPLSMPSLIVMTTLLSRPVNHIFPEHTVILCAPLPVVIFIFGNSYASWLLAGISFVSGVWLLQHTSFGMHV